MNINLSQLNKEDWELSLSRDGTESEKEFQIEFEKLCKKLQIHESYWITNLENPTVIIDITLVNKLLKTGFHFPLFKKTNVIVNELNLTDTDILIDLVSEYSDLKLTREQLKLALENKYTKEQVKKLFNVSAHEYTNKADSAIANELSKIFSNTNYDFNSNVVAQLELIKKNISFDIDEVKDFTGIDEMESDLITIVMSDHALTKVAKMELLKCMLSIGGSKEEQIGFYALNKSLSYSEFSQKYNEFIADTSAIFSKLEYSYLQDCYGYSKTQLELMIKLLKANGEDINHDNIIAIAETLELNTMNFVQEMKKSFDETLTNLSVAELSEHYADIKALQKENSELNNQIQQLKDKVEMSSLQSNAEDKLEEVVEELARAKAELDNEKTHEVFVLKKVLRLYSNSEFSIGTRSSKKGIIKEYDQFCVISANEAKSIIDKYNIKEIDVLFSICSVTI